MIQGVVNDAYEAVISFSLERSSGQPIEIQAVIDTGYSGFLTLPLALIEELGLSSVGRGHAVLANDYEVEFDVYAVTVLWDGQPRFVEADAAGSTPLVGMLLLDRHTLNIDVETGGSVLVQARA